MPPTITATGIENGISLTNIFSFLSGLIILFRWFYAFFTNPII